MSAYMRANFITRKWSRISLSFVFSRAAREERERERERALARKIWWKRIVIDVCFALQKQSKNYSRWNNDYFLKDFPLNFRRVVNKVICIHEILFFTSDISCFFFYSINFDRQVKFIRFKFGNFFNYTENNIFLLTINCNKIIKRWKLNCRGQWAYMLWYILL